MRFAETINQWTVDKKPKAIDIEVLSTAENNEFKNKTGVVLKRAGPEGVRIHLLRLKPANSDIYSNGRMITPLML